MDGIISNLTPFFTYISYKQRGKEKETPAGVVRTEHTLTHGSDWYNYLSSFFLSLPSFLIYISRRGMLLLLLLLLLLLYVRTYARTHARTPERGRGGYEYISACPFVSVSCCFFKLRAHFNGHIVVSRKFFSF